MNNSRTGCFINSLLKLNSVSSASISSKLCLCLWYDGRQLYRLWYLDGNNIFQIGPKKQMIPHYEEILLLASTLLLFVPGKGIEGVFQSSSQK